MDLVNHRKKVRAGAVHLVYEADARDIVFGGLVPDCLGLRFHAADRAEEPDCAVQDAQRALDLHSEVHVAGSVDDVDHVLVPDAGRGCALDGDAALTLLRHEIHRCRAIVRLTQLVSAPCIIENTLRAGRFSRIDMRHNTNVADFVQRHCAIHSCSPLNRQNCRNLYNIAQF